jgi:hypothetical protein
MMQWQLQNVAAHRKNVDVPDECDEKCLTKHSPSPLKTVKLLKQLAGQ